MNNPELTKPMRQSPLGIILFALVAGRKFIKAFWPIILIYIVKNNSMNDEVKFYIYLIVLFIVLLLIFHAVLTYMYFYFRIENNEFIVNKGYLKKVKLSIPLDRIQTINIKQNIFQQVLKLVSLEIDTAGSAGKELKIIALKKPFAEEIQRQLTMNKPVQSDETGELKDEVITEEAGKLIMHLKLDDLIKVGITENHFKSALAILAIGYGFIQQLENLFKENIDSATQQAESFLTNSGSKIYIILFLLVLFVGFMFSIIKTIIVYYNLSLTRIGQKFILVSGLFNKKTLTVPYSKIQVLSWSTNPLRKIMDFVTVNITQASSNERNKKQAILIPGCSTKHKNSILAEVFPDTQNLVWDKHRFHFIFFIRIWLVRGIIPALLAAFIWNDYAFIYAVSAVWLVFAAFLSFLSYRKYYFRISESLIEKSSGTIGKKNMRMFNFKVQNVKYKQTFFQRRRNLATVRIYTAGGKQLSIPYIDNSLAMELFNYLLMKVESDNRKWM